jgi:hypothetical protein
MAATGFDGFSIAAFERVIHFKNELTIEFTRRYADLKSFARHFANSIVASSDNADRSSHFFTASRQYKPRDC